MHDCLQEHLVSFGAGRDKHFVGMSMFESILHHFLILVGVLEPLPYKTCPPLTCSLTSLCVEIMTVLLEATFLLQGFWSETFPNGNLLVRVDL